MSHSAPNPLTHTKKNTKIQQNATRLKDQLHDGLVEDDQVWKRRTRDFRPASLADWSTLENIKSNTNQIKSSSLPGEKLEIAD